MVKVAPRLYIGTSGFFYPHWREGVFYPKDLPRTKQLAYYAARFNTVELNSTFYRLPRAKTFSRWAKQVPENFIFAVKASRFITHIKKLNHCQEPWQMFLERAVLLGDRLGPFLFQFPPAWKKNIKRLKDFLGMVKKTNERYFLVFEFRHPSWFSKDVYQFLKGYKNASLCLVDSPCWPFREIVTGGFVYIRMHGRKKLYSSFYTRKELGEWAEKIKRYLKEGLDVFVYFNNDAQGFAVENAKTLRDFLK